MKETSPLDFSFHLLAFLVFQTNYVVFTAVPVGTAMLNFLPSGVQSSLRNDFVSRFFVAALGNALYGFAIVADYLSPGVGFWIALMGRLLIGFSIDIIMYFNHRPRIHQRVVVVLGEHNTFLMTIVECELQVASVFCSHTNTLKCYWFNAGMIPAAVILEEPR